MTLPESSQRNTREKPVTLKRRRLIRKFWFSKNADEILFISAPMLYGKTTAVLDAMEELKRKYIYLRFDFAINSVSELYRRLSGRVANSAPKQAENLESQNIAAELKNSEAVILDDFQFCKGKPIFDAVKDLLKMYGSITRFIIISRSDLPNELEIYKYSHKISFMTEKDFAFSETEIKKLAEQNRMCVGNAHARRLCERSAGCAGFIMESLLSERSFSNATGLPLGVKSYIDGAVAKYISKGALKILYELSHMDEIPLSVIEGTAGGKNNLKKIMGFMHETGLAGLKNDKLIPHKLLKMYLKSERPPENRLESDIYNKLILCKAYADALDYALKSTDKRKIEDALCYFYSENIIISDNQLEKLYSVYSGGEDCKIANPFLHLYRIKMGQSAEVSSLLELCDDYDGIKASLNSHIFTVPYPNHISGASDGDSMLIECKKLFDAMRFGEVLDLLRDLCGKYAGKLQCIYYCLLIDTLRNLNMYTIVEKEMSAFEIWAQGNLDYYELFEIFRARIYIIDCDVETAKEWLSQKTVPMTIQISRKNIENRITDAMAYIASGETECAIWWLKNALDFALRADLVHIRAQCYALLSLSYRQKNRVSVSVSYMEKALELITLHDCPSIICNLGRDTVFAVEHCYLKLKSKNLNSTLLKKLLLYIKRKDCFGGFASCKSGEITLSKRQTEILWLLTEEKTYIQIAEQLGVKITTVRDHIKRLYEKLEVRNAEDAISKAHEKGIVKFHD